MYRSEVHHDSIIYSPLTASGTGFCIRVSEIVSVSAMNNQKNILVVRFRNNEKIERFFDSPESCREMLDAFHAAMMRGSAGRA